GVGSGATSMLERDVKTDWPSGWRGLAGPEALGATSNGGYVPWKYPGPARLPPPFNDKNPGSFWPLLRCDSSSRATTEPIFGAILPVALIGFLAIWFQF